MEITNSTMYSKYGISEWKEKNLILSETEREIVLSDLQRKHRSPLVELIYLPFPQFATCYFKRFQSTNRYTEDPAFGYKLFLMPESTLEGISEIICSIDFKTASSKTYKKGVLAQFEEYLREPINRIPFAMDGASHAKEINKKFVYLTQFIDLNEAQKLKLPIAQYFEKSGEDGYELQNKLSLLNPVPRSVIESYYGLNGKEKLSKDAISKKLTISSTYVEYLLQFVVPLLHRTLGEMQERLGFLGLESDLFIYENRTYRNIDLKLEMDFYYNNILTETEREALATETAESILIYITRKYLYPSMTIQDLSNYISKDIYKIQRLELKEKSPNS